MKYGMTFYLCQFDTITGARATIILFFDIIYRAVLVKKQFNLYDNVIIRAILY